MKSYDFVDAPQAYFAYNLKKNYGEKCQLRWSPDAGHSAIEKTTARMLCEVRCAVQC